MVQGDGLDIILNIGKTVGDFVGDAVEKAWFSVKTAPSATTYLFQVLGTINDSGNVSGTAQVTFPLANAQTILLVNGTVYYFDVQVKTTLGGATKPYTPLSGKVKFVREITTDTV